MERCDPMIRRLWLDYFNRALYQQSVIDKAAYRQMRLWIHSGKAGVFPK